MPKQPFSIRLNDDEVQRIEALRNRLQELQGPLVTITQRHTILRAIEELEKYLDKLDRERGRKR